MSDHTRASRRRRPPLPENGELYGVLAEYDTPGELVEAAAQGARRRLHRLRLLQPVPGARHRRGDGHQADDPAAAHLRRRHRRPDRRLAPAVVLQRVRVAVEHLRQADVVASPRTSRSRSRCTILLVGLHARSSGCGRSTSCRRSGTRSSASSGSPASPTTAFFLGIEAQGQALRRRRDQAAARGRRRASRSRTATSIRIRRRSVMPRWLSPSSSSSTAFALIPFAIAAKARNSHSSEPHYPHLPGHGLPAEVQVRHRDRPVRRRAREPRRDPRHGRARLRSRTTTCSTAASTTACDASGDGGRSGRLPGAQIRTARRSGRLKLLERGQSRFNIYCTPCHGYDGHGHGMVPQRVAAPAAAPGRRATSSTRDRRRCTMPNGQLFNTISNGYNTMRATRPRSRTADRWAIVAYVRALQRSQNATVDDVPATQGSGLQMPDANAPRLRHTGSDRERGQP